MVAHCPRTQTAGPAQPEIVMNSSCVPRVSKSVRLVAVTDVDVPLSAMLACQASGKQTTTDKRYITSYLTIYFLRHRALSPLRKFNIGNIAA